MGEHEDAPGWPGIPPTWTSSAKDGVGTVLSTGGPRIWFTLGHGILNEIYWPRIDSPQVRDIGFIVADGRGFWSEVKRDAQHQLETPAPGIPAFRVTHQHERYTLHLDYCCDPERDVLLIQARLTAPEPLRLYVLTASHLGNSGAHNTAWTVKGPDGVVLVAQRGEACLAVAARQGEHGGFVRASAGFVGVSDGWQDFALHGGMTWEYERASDGNVALLGELASAEATIAVGFGDTPELAATLARCSLQFRFEQIWTAYVAVWEEWQARLQLPFGLEGELLDLARTSAMVLKAHEDHTVPGAIVASLSIPWGQSRDDVGGYHLVWARDLVESAGGLLAIGAAEDAQRVLAYLIATQQPDGHWVQNQWLDGRPFWQGIQLDEVGFPILLASLLRERGALADLDVRRMVLRAARYLARNGPVTDQDRWEEDRGYSPFTLAVEIAAMVCAADFLDEPARTYALELADTWNSQIEAWTYVTGSELARRIGVDGYYVRIAPDEPGGLATPGQHLVWIKNRPYPLAKEPASEVVSLEFLALVRFGLRRADDPRIVNSLAVADAVLKVETPSGPAWHRYTSDGYGEHDDGSPFDGTGTGRAWPLLTGERGHVALMLGESVEPYLRAMARMASKGGMIPEQVWDAPDIPARGLFCGRPTGAAMPLAWAHAEYLKLAASSALGYPFDRPWRVWERYRGLVPEVPWVCWRFTSQIPVIPTGHQLRLELLAPACVRWTTDGWQSWQDDVTQDRGLGVHVLDLPVRDLPTGTRVEFTVFWLEVNRWEGRNFTVEVQPAANESSLG